MDEGGTVRWTDGTLRWTAPPTLREGEPVLKIGRERVPSPRGKSAPGRVRRPRPRPRRCTRPAPISKTTTEAMRKTTGCHRTRSATFRVAARYLADPVTSSRLRRRPTPGSVPSSGGDSGRAPSPHVGRAGAVPVLVGASSERCASPACSRSWGRRARSAATSFGCRSSALTAGANV
jgi:hypothetical protein